MAQVTFQGEGFAKPVVARFDLPDASSDGGLVLFKALCARSSRSAADQSMCWHCGACSWLLQDVWGAARPRGALATAAVVEFGVVVGFVIRR